jgi:hypothetical protein
LTEKLNKTQHDEAKLAGHSTVLTLLSYNFLAKTAFDLLLWVATLPVALD